MKIFGFYISRIDWETLYNFERESIIKERSDWVKYLERTRQPRDTKGRFISKQKLIHDQMKAYYNKPIDYTAVKKASKI